MKLKKMIVFSLVGLVSAVGITTSVSAADSNANIIFTEGVGAPDIIDPTDPSLPYDSTDPTDPQNAPTGETGSLTLDFVSTVDFGQQSIEAGTQVYESTILRPFIQVSDRRGSGTGWNVTAQLSEFTETGEATLPGAVLTFSGGTVISESTSTAPTPNSDIILNPGEAAATVVSADEDAGLGSWITRWFPTEGATLNDNVTLEVPSGSATVGSHTATITWTLTSGPTAPTP